MTLVIVIGLIFWVFFLQSTVSRLDRRLERMERNQLGGMTSVNQGANNNSSLYTAAPSADSAISPITPPHTFTPQLVSQPVSGSAEGTAEVDDSVDRFMQWLKEDFMMKLGALLLILAMGWFVSYAFAIGLIGEFGRIALGLLLGAGLMAAGVWRVKDYAHQGGVLLVTGSATVLLTVYAARAMYEMFDPYSALLIMFLAVVFVAYVSVEYNRRSLALASLILAGIAPFLTASPSASVMESSLYLLVITLGTLWVVYLRGWSILTFTALVIVFFHHLPFLIFGSSADEALIGLWFGFLFTAIFYVASLIGFLINDVPEEHGARIYTALGSVIYLATWVLVGADPVWHSLIFAAAALIFAVGGFLTYQITSLRDPFYVYGGASLLFVVAALASELSGPVLTLAYIALLVVLVYLTRYTLNETDLAVRLCTLFVLPIFLSTSSMVSAAWQSGSFHSDSAVLAFMIVAMVLVARALDSESVTFMKSLAWSVASIYGVILVWLITHAGAYGSAYDFGTMIALTIYTVAAIAAIMLGGQSGRPGVALGGKVLLGLVVARLILVDVWDMNILPQIVTFFVLGVLLISTAFIAKKKPTNN